MAKPRRRRSQRSSGGDGLTSLEFSIFPGSIQPSSAGESPPRLGFSSGTGGASEPSAGSAVPETSAAAAPKFGISIARLKISRQTDALHICNGDYESFLLL